MFKGSQNNVIWQKKTKADKQIFACSESCVLETYLCVYIELWKEFNVSLSVFKVKSILRAKSQTQYQFYW